jgi:hypothetical protein
MDALAHQCLMIDDTPTYMGDLNVSGQVPTATLTSIFSHCTDTHTRTCSRLRVGVITFSQCAISFQIVPIPI